MTNSVYEFLYVSVYFYIFIPLFGLNFYTIAMLTLFYLILLVSSVWKFYYFEIPILPGDISNLFELFFAVDGWTQFKFVLVFICLTSIFAFAVYKAKKPKIRSVVFSISLLVFSFASVLSTYDDLISTNTYERAFPERNLRELGMTTSFLMEFVESNKNIQKPSESEISEIYKKFKSNSDFPIGKLEKQNVYIIIVESLWDVENIFSNEGGYFEEKFLEKYNESGSKVAIVNDKFLGTSKTEFEVLCGYPHLGEAIIFKSSINKKNDCLPNVLSRFNYVTNAYHPYKRSFYNREYAYPSIGFQNYLSKESFKLNEGENFLNDVDFFKQVYEKIKNKNDQSKRPQLHYILTIATHYPFTDNKNKINISPSVNSKVIGNYINSVYVATNEINKFIDKIKREDPESLFVVVGDHAPPVGPTIFNAASKKKRDVELRYYEPLYVPLMTLGFKKELPKYISTYHLNKFLLEELNILNEIPSYLKFNSANENVNYKKEIVFNLEGKVVEKKKPAISKEVMRKILMDEFYGNQYLKRMIKTETLGKSR